jgi:hypothetical protein
MARPRESIHIDISGTDSRHTLLDFSRFLYHLDLVYEISRLATDAKYHKYRFPKHTFRPVVSPLEPDDLMFLSRVRHESPWELSVLLHDPMALLTSGLGALWLFIQCLERISTLGLNRRKLRAEIDKLLLDAEKQRRELETTDSHDPPSLTAKEAEARIPRKKPSELEVPRVYVIEPPTENASLVPPNESMRLYRRLKRRGAKHFYDSNINAIGRLGFEVKDCDIGTDSKD